MCNFHHRTKITDNMRWIHCFLCKLFFFSSLFLVISTLCQHYVQNVTERRSYLQLDDSLPKRTNCCGFPFRKKPSNPAYFPRGLELEPLLKLILASLTAEKLTKYLKNLSLFPGPRSCRFQFQLWLQLYVRQVTCLWTRFEVRLG